MHILACSRNKQTLDPVRLPERIPKVLQDFTIDIYIAAASNQAKSKTVEEQPRSSGQTFRQGNSGRRGEREL